MEETEQQTAGEEETNNNIPQAGKAKTGHLESVHYSVISQTTPDGRIMIGQDIEIFPGKECKEFASAGTEAYDAKDRRSSGSQFTILCGRSGVPRVTTIGSYKNLKNKHILKLVEAGIINWTPENRQRFAFIFEKPAGKKMLESPEANPLRIADDRLIPAVIQPAVSVLSDFRNIDLIHGSINPENLFLVGAGGLETVVLGECLSSAPSFTQHPFYEMTSRAMAKSSGRGPGTIKDDLYALGVCVAMMARGENLLLGKDPQRMIYDKIEHGSYGAIIGRERIPGGIAEFLRGVLNDDEEQRWGIDDTVKWLEGRRQSPKQSRTVLKSARSLVFLEHKYWDLRSIAEAFSENIAEAAVEIEKGQFESWVKRNFEDKSLILRIGKVLASEKSAAREKLVASVCMAIDPSGPIRFKGLSIFPPGFGTALAEAMTKGGDIQIFVEIILQQLCSSWLSQAFEEVQDAGGLIGTFEKCRSSLTQRMPGYGIERVLYMLNPEVACLSPALKDYFVLTPGSLLLALESISRQAQRPSVILDRHMIAFISVREPKMIDQHLGYVNSRDKGNQMIGIIRTLAAIQRRFATGPVPGVGNWIISLTPPLIELLNDRDLRQSVTKQVNRLQDGGNLTAILDLVDDRLLVQDDAQRFAMARNEYAALVREKGDIETFLKKRKNFGKATGRQVAMIVSSILSVIIIAGYVALRFMKSM